MASLKFRMPLPNAAAELRQPVRAEDHDGDHEDDQHLGHAKVHTTPVRCAGEPRRKLPRLASTESSGDLYRRGVWRNAFCNGIRTWPVKPLECPLSGRRNGVPAAPSRGWSWRAVGSPVGAARPGRVPARFSSGVQAVEVYATVTDGAGEPVTGLRADDFEVDDDGQPQDDFDFRRGRLPADGGARRGPQPRAWRASRCVWPGAPRRRFSRQLRPGDRSMVVAISADADVIAPLDGAARGAARRRSRRSMPGAPRRCATRW